MTKKINKFICSRCDKVRPEIECYCDSCFKETFNLPFGFIESEGLTNDYYDYVDKKLKKRWVKNDTK